MKKFEKKIEISYINYISSNNKRPNTLKEIFINDDSDDIDPNTISSLTNNTIENNIWSNTILTSIKNASSDPNFQEYSVREKLLSFFFNLSVGLQQHQDFFTYSSNIHSPFELKEVNDRREKIVETITPFLTQLIQEGISTGEVEERMFIQDYYINVMLTQLFLIIKYWAEDTSNEKENTDEAVEKSVHLIMDLIGPNFTDSAFSFAKFIFQK
ncbi:TetR/AcrR family transcriptional regulator [Flammeovirga pacifica]|uniref:Tetracyclin repressor-like C-terminal domain-containing protein n=1 Tax=Flammeovirga pacifica TaxID=915059 RepID=A0A1S1YW87_FLAPC|nr:TetR/AcrR family transcriptional regulator [Flammeovirga pacifica]OHX65292.1 hypothetical protein NH26_02480 [Flammeovirga pacifica]